jgi:hypothetical protein
MMPGALGWLFALSMGALAQEPGVAEQALRRAPVARNACGTADQPTPRKRSP